MLQQALLAVAADMPTQSSKVKTGISGRRLALTGHPSWCCRTVQVSNALRRIEVRWNAYQGVHCGANDALWCAVAKCMRVPT